jgi:hypothetical protein
MYTSILKLMSCFSPSNDDDNDDDDDDVVIAL